MATGFNTQTGKGEYRLQFETDNKELFLLMQETARRCVDGKPQTNADSIRAMTDEELADWMYNGISTDPCDYCEYNNGHCDGSPCRGKADAETIIEWLQRPAE